MIAMRRIGLGVCLLGMIALPSIGQDTCGSAVQITVPGSAGGATIGATVDSVGACGSASIPTAPGVWYFVIGNGNQITASFCNASTSYNSQLSVFRNGCGSLTCVGGNNDFCGTQSEVSWCSVNGTQYWILVHGSGSATGTFQLDILDDDCSSLNSECTVGVCNAPSGNCIAQSSNETLPCNGVACVGGETCTAGTCGGGTSVDCSAAGDDCNIASCNAAGAEGNCDTLTPTNESGTCDDGDACTLGTTCTAGVCGGGGPPDCTAFDDDCNTASCDLAGVDGNCDTLTPSNEAGACDDGDACTLGTTCTAGACGGGGPPNCASFDDDCNTASCNPAGVDGNCDTLTPTNEAGACSGDPCLSGEVCTGGVCGGGSAIDCSTAGDDCNTASCDPGGAEGNCDSLATINEGGACDDGMACTLSTVCAVGVCGGGNAPDCSTFGDDCNAASCDPIGVDGNCDTITPANESGACDDGQACTMGTTCTVGVCGGGGPPDCSTAGGDCNTAACDPVGADGNCDTLTPTNQGLSCDDGFACVVGTLCDSGSCVGGGAPNCLAAGDDCNDASCNAAGAEGNCDILTPANETLPCDVNNACNVGATCSVGSCTGGTAPDCSTAGDACNIASCDSNGVDDNCDILTSTNDGGACDDADQCNVGETCLAGICQGGSAQDCSAAGDDCNAASCDPVGVEGNCAVLTSINEGLGCDDGNACLLSTTCAVGACQGGSPPVCTAFDDDCNTASCDLAGVDGNCDTLTPANQGLACDDGLTCTINTTCDLGVCQGGGPPNCALLGNDCNDASCDPLGLAGNCDTLTPANQGATCDDGDVCLVNSTCDVGVCGGGASPNCTPFDNACNFASCDPAGTEGNCDILTPGADGVFCNDGDPCNVGETCLAGICQAGAPPNCTGVGNDCNTASCDPAGSEGNCGFFTPVNDGGACNDGGLCVTGATCLTGVCQGGSPIDCTSLDSDCTIGICIAATGACATQPISEGLPCDDALACTLNDVCTAGTCSGTVVDCSILNGPCVIGICDPGSGSCFSQPANNGVGCDDGNLCTTNDVCFNGNCTGIGLDCTAFDDDCNIGACSPGTGTCSAVIVNEGNGCDDLDPCTSGDVCASGVCAGGPLDCTFLDDACNTGTCNPATTSCEAVAQPDNTSCDDGLFCNGLEVCVGGACPAALPPCGGANELCDELNDQCINDCIYDCNLSGTIGTEDFAFFLGCVGTFAFPGDFCECADYNRNTAVDSGDLGGFLGCFGEFCPCGSGLAAVAMPRDAELRLVVSRSPATADYADQPGRSVQQLQQGRNYYVHVWASLGGQSVDQLACAFADLTFDPDQISLTDLQPANDFSLLQFPTDEQDFDVLTNVGGCIGIQQLDDRPNARWARLATLRIEVFESFGATHFQLSEPTSPFAGVAILGLNENLHPSQVRFGGMTLPLSRGSRKLGRSGRGR